MKKLFLPLLLLVPLLAAQAVTIENGDFSQKKDRWSGDGDVIGLDAVGNPAETPETTAGYALEIKLHTSDWSYLEQRLNTAREPGELKELKITYEVQALPDYVPLADSPAYTTTGEVPDWKTDNWYYGREEVVYPKASFVVRLTDKHYRYAPRTIPSDGAWRTLKLDFQMLKEKDRVLRFMFPPGTGTIRIRNIQQVQ